MSPALKALSSQLAGWALAIAAARAGWLPAGIWPLVAVQVASAMGAATAFGSDRWWLAIHLGFAPMLILAGRLGIAPGWYLGGFGLLAAIYWTSFRTQVPLYLSNRRTAEAVARLLPEGRSLRLLDLGSGTGSLLRPLARRRPDCRFEGVEAAPAPWLISRLLARRLDNVAIRRGDFFAGPWSDYEVVYAFLSPVPMPAVWEKAERELAPGALLVSNSFPVPGRKPREVVEVADRRATTLYVYEVGKGRRAK